MTLCYNLAMISRDILFISLAVAVLVATGFWVALMYYLIQIIRGLRDVVQGFQHRLAAIDEILQTIKDKLTSTHLELAALGGGLKQLIQFFVNRKTKRRSGSRASANTED